MKQFFVDGTGTLSMARLLSAVTVGVVLLLLSILNIAAIILSICKGVPLVFIDVPSQCQLLVLTVFGGKVLQGIFGEKTTTP